MKLMVTIGVVAAAMLLPAVPAAHGQGVATTKGRVRMVQAFCSTGPCSPGYSFDSGSGLLNRMKQPKPFSKRKVGRVRLLRVQSTPLPSALSGQVTARFIWDSVDPDGDCPELGNDVVQTLATSSMFCNQQGGHASCAGDLLVPMGLFDPRCTDVRVTLEDIRFEVYEFNQVGVETSLIATDGVSILPNAIDCSSGGTGCP